MERTIKEVRLPVIDGTAKEYFLDNGEKIDLIDLKSKIVMTFEGNTYKIA